MRIFVHFLFWTFFVASAAFTQSSDNLSAEEVAGAIAQKAGSGFVKMAASFGNRYGCTQWPSISIYTPEGWLNALNVIDHKQFLAFAPTPADMMRALTIISQGCAAGTSAGPQCESITRVALLSDTKGQIVVEAVKNEPLTQAWQNGFGASAACSALVSKFSLNDLQKVRDKDGEFLVATFSGSQPPRMYSVKKKQLQSLGI
jgi:hypothetical protein